MLLPAYRRPSCPYSRLPAMMFVGPTKVATPVARLIVIRLCELADPPAIPYMIPVVAL
jgi:hypothetical protein